MTDLPKNIQGLIKEHDIQFVDFHFADFYGAPHHIAYHIDQVDGDLIEQGLMFDGSSIDGWQPIHNSDMQLKPQAETARIDPFSVQPTINILCDIYSPETNKPYNRDPRSLAKRAESYLQGSGVADQAFFGPEAEFFIFDDVRFEQTPTSGFYALDDREAPENSGASFDGGNSGHRPRPAGGYVPLAPVDKRSDLRAEMVRVMAEYGLKPEKHHHEVAPSQGEIGFHHGTLTDCADNLMAYKYIVKNVADSFGKSATFMPKPIFGDNGSGMHCHISLWKEGQPLFAGADENYAGLSDEALYFIGGVIKHAKALNAFANPTTNSYKRLVPGYEAPVICAYSARNRSAACRIPHTTSRNARRFEVRFPDPAANPYLLFSALLMAGLDGIENKINPGEPHDENLYALSAAELAKLPHVAGSLGEALDALSADHAFLLKGDVFDKDMIKGYVALKREEIARVSMTPNPAEFELYYSA